MKRIEWIDFGKGLTIFLVFLGHVNLGLLQSGRFEVYNRGFLFIIELLYIFHIPVFFALSGYFFQPLADGKSYWHYVKKKTLVLGIPYLFYSVIQFALQRAGGSAVRDPARLSDLLAIYKMPLGVSWYLYVLWAIYLVLGLLSIFIKNKKWLFAFTAIGFAAALLFPLPIYLLQKLLLWSFFFMLGSFLREINYRFNSWKTASCVFLPCFFSLAAFMWFWQKQGFTHYTSYDRPGLWGLIFMVSVLLAFALYPMLDKTKFAPYFVAKGKDSLAIYILHAPIISVIRIVLFKLGIEALWLHLLFGIAGGWFVISLAVSIFKKIPLLTFFLYPQKIIGSGKRE
ncbi:acyltransferase family protein [Streptococcus macacae]|uniref:Acyltransferase n=1 Tax=Streptococcus macacae NCTC 11558 TaxID=764298 RepID=G5JUI4_9STRE|nr:acyltransferase [Streptococcus macacae]EHJ51624.1 acyltransferase [Streptococcus macacae NCTC 11558]SUN78626.1 putative acetyl transferase [Streptococcus macacae NCTC 11558]